MAKKIAAVLFFCVCTFCYAEDKNFVAADNGVEVAADAPGDSAAEPEGTQTGDIAETYAETPDTQEVLSLNRVSWKSILSLKLSMLIPAAAFAVLCLAGFVLALLNFISGANKKNIGKIEERINKMEKDNNAVIQTQQKSLDDLKKTPWSGGDELVSQADVSRIDTRVSVLEQELRSSNSARDDLSQRLAVLETDKKNRDGIKNGALTPLEVFNSWARNPSTPLPEAFYYLQGDFRILATHIVKETIDPAKWISNRYGNTKYLLPNPNFFDPMTNISELYDMNMTRLRARGENKIQVTKPCEMLDNGYVNYPGELQLL